MKWNAKSMWWRFRGRCDQCGGRIVPGVIGTLVTTCHIHGIRFVSYGQDLGGVPGGVVEAVATNVPVRWCEKQCGEPSLTADGKRLQADAVSIAMQTYRNGLVS